MKTHKYYNVQPTLFTCCICCGLILSYYNQTHYHTLQYPKTKEKNIWTKGKIEPQHIHQAKIAVFYSKYVTLKGKTDNNGKPFKCQKCTHEEWLTNGTWSIWTVYLTVRMDE